MVTYFYLKYGFLDSFGRRQTSSDSKQGSLAHGGTGLAEGGFLLIRHRAVWAQNRAHLSQGGALLRNQPQSEEPILENVGLFRNRD